MSFEREDTAHKMNALIADELRCDPKSIQLTSTFQDLGADSLDMVQIIMRAEEQFGIEINDADVEKMNNLSDVITYIHERRKK